MTLRNCGYCLTRCTGGKQAFKAQPKTWFTLPMWVFSHIKVNLQQVPAVDLQANSLSFGYIISVLTTLPSSWVASSDVTLNLWLPRADTSQVRGKRSDQVSPSGSPLSGCRKSDQAATVQATGTGACCPEKTTWRRKRILLAHCPCATGWRKR